MFTVVCGVFQEQVDGFTQPQCLIYCKVSEKKKAFFKMRKNFVFANFVQKLHIIARNARCKLSGKNVFDTFSQCLINCEKFRILSTVVWYFPDFKDAKKFFYL